MVKTLKEFTDRVASWREISLHSHRFGGTEFRFGSAELGHIHSDGTLDIPFTRAVRDALLDENLAEEHRWVPNSGWTTFRVRTEKDFTHALWLMRLSYLRYSLKSAEDPRRLFDQENATLRLSARLQSLVEGSSSLQVSPRD
jgi:Family of unknown function (DUF5519)